VFFGRVGWTQGAHPPVSLNVKDVAVFSLLRAPFLELRVLLSSFFFRRLRLFDRFLREVFSDRC